MSVSVARATATRGSSSATTAGGSAPPLSTLAQYSPGQLPLSRFLARIAAMTTAAVASSWGRVRVCGLAGTNRMSHCQYAMRCMSGRLERVVPVFGRCYEQCPCLVVDDGRRRERARTRADSPNVDLDPVWHPDR